MAIKFVVKEIGRCTVVIAASSCSDMASITIREGDTETGDLSEFVIGFDACEALFEAISELRESGPDISRRTFDE